MQIKSEKLTPFGRIFSIMEEFGFLFSFIVNFLKNKKIYEFDIRN